MDCSADLLCSAYVLYLLSEQTGGSKVCCVIDGANGVMLLPPIGRTSRGKPSSAAAGAAGAAPTASKESSHTEKQRFAFDYVFGDGPDVEIDGQMFERNSQERVFKELGPCCPRRAEPSAHAAVKCDRARRVPRLLTPFSWRLFGSVSLLSLSLSLAHLATPRLAPQDPSCSATPLLDSTFRCWLTDRLERARATRSVQCGQREGERGAQGQTQRILCSRSACLPACLSSLPQVSGYDSSRTLTDDKSKDESGLIPRICNVLFSKAAADSAADPLCSYAVSVSYLEIYSEKIQDLLDKSKRNLTVRNHPSRGPYVEGLTIKAVESYGEMHALIEQGNAIRTVAATNMNAQSSRSHAVFTVQLTQTKRDPEVKLASKVESKIQLVDLAGSERQDTSGATGLRLKEAAQINLSLSTLGRVISALAAKSQQEASGKPVKLDENFGQAAAAFSSIITLAHSRSR